MIHRLFQVDDGVFVISVLLIYGCISSSTKLQVMKNPKGQPNVIHSAYKDAWSSLMDMQTDVDILKVYLLTLI